jgi:hypothetical protein
MDATVLRDTYERLAAIAEAGHIKLPSGEQWSAELVVAHAIATNRTLVLLGIQILDGRDASYAGGTLSVRSAWLESIIQSTGNFAGLASIGLPLVGGPLVQAAGFRGWPWQLCFW